MEQMLPLDKLLANPLNPRKSMDPEYINELSQSLQTHGQLDAILVRPVDNGRWEIIAGHCRVQAARSVGWTQIRAHVKPMNDEQADFLLLATNLARRSLNPVEEARGIHVMISRHEWTQAVVAQRFGKSQKWVSERLSLVTRLVPEVQEAIPRGIITPWQAKEIAKAPAEAQPAIAAKVQEADLSARETEKLVKVVTDPATPADVRRAAVASKKMTPEHAEAIAKAESPALRQGLILAVDQGQLTPEQARHEVETAARREQAPASITSAHVQRRVNVFAPLNKAVEALESIEAEDVFRLGSEGDKDNPFTDPVSAARESIGRITTLVGRIGKWLDAAENNVLAPPQGGTGKLLRFPGAGGTAS